MECYAKALAVYQSTVGENHPDKAEMYDIMGNSFYNKGDYDRSLEMHAKALAVRQSTVGSILTQPPTSTWGMPTS